MNPTQSDEFYIGWEAKAASGIGKTVRKIVAALFLLALFAPVVLAVSQRMIGASVFEWGTHKTFSGILQTTPYPHLLVPRPGNANGLTRFSTYYLVAPWKFGLNPQAIAMFAGKSARWPPSSASATRAKPSSPAWTPASPRCRHPRARPGRGPSCSIRMA